MRLVIRCFLAERLKLSDRRPETRVCAKRGEAKARHVPGFMAGAHAVTEPVEGTAALNNWTPGLRFALARLC